MKNKKAVLLLLVFGFCLASVNAVWVFLLSDTALITVGSANPTAGYGISLVDPIDDIVIDASGSPQTITEAFSYDNLGIERDLVMDFEVTRLDVEDGCFDYEDDIYVSLVGPAWIPVFNSGDTVTIREGLNNWEMEVYAEANSCPQSVTVDLELHQ